jgi:hypothetical protein
LIASSIGDQEKAGCKLVTVEPSGGKVVMVFICEGGIEMVDGVAEEHPPLITGDNINTSPKTKQPPNTACLPEFIVFL